MPTTDTGELRDARDAVIREHMESENRLDFDATLATFDRPRYELVATGQVFDGEDEVRQYYAGSRRAFPDQRNESTRFATPRTPFWSSSTCSAPTSATSPATLRRAGSSAAAWRRCSSSQAIASPVSGCTSTRARSSASSASRVPGPSDEDRRTTRPKRCSHHHAHRAGEVRVVIVFVRGVPETTRLLDPAGATGRVPSSP